MLLRRSVVVAVAVPALLVALAIPVRAESRLAVAYHGLRFLGLDAQEEARLQSALVDALQSSPYLRLATSGPAVSERCKRDIHCHCRAGRERRGARALFGNIGRIGGTFTFELVLVDTQSCATENSVFVSEAHDVDSARARLAALVTRLATPSESVSETVVKDERDVDLVPAIVTVFTAKQLLQYGITTLDEVFRLVPGFETMDTNWATTVLHYGLATTVLYLADGNPLSNPMFQFRDLGKDLALSLNHVARLEFVRGPGSVLWGPNAFFGMVNLITHLPTETAPRLRAQVRGGTLGTGDFYASAEQRHRYFRYHLSSTFNISRGAPTMVENSLLGDTLGTTPPEKWTWGNGGATTNEPSTYWDIVFKLEVLRRLQFVFQEIHHENKFSISPSGSLLPPGQGGFWDKAHRLYGVSWEDRLPRGFRYRLSGSRYEHKFWESWVVHPLSSVVPAGSRYLQGNEVERAVSHLVEARLYHSFERGPIANQALLGVTYLQQHMPNSYGDVIGIFERPTMPTLDQKARSFYHVAGYLQEDISFRRWLFLSGGLRWEGVRREQLANEAASPFTSVLSTQAALIAVSRWASGKLVWAEGFRPPDPNMLFSTVGVVGNPSLHPERSRALSLEGATRLGPLRLRVGGTRISIIDQITLKDEGGGVLTPHNEGSTTIYGVYGELGLEWEPWVSAFAGYDYKHLAESNPVGRGIAAAPHTASAGLSVRPLNDLSLYATSSFVSSRTVQAYQPNALPALRSLGDTWYLTLGLWLTNVFDRFDVGLKVQNPFGFAHLSVDTVGGNTVYILERRRVSEVLLTVRFSRVLDLLEGGGARRGTSGATQSQASGPQVPRASTPSQPAQP